jgi:hypothetical protein
MAHTNHPQNELTVKPIARQHPIEDSLYLSNLYCQQAFKRGEAGRSIGRQSVANRMRQPIGKPIKTVVLTVCRDMIKVVNNRLENNKAASPLVEPAPSCAKTDEQPAPITSPQSGNSNVAKIEREVNRSHYPTP